MSGAISDPPPAARPIRLRQVCLLTGDLYGVADDLVGALGLAVCHGKADLTRYGVPYEPPPAHSAAFFAEHGLVNALLPVGEEFIEIVMPTRPDTPASRYLERRGEGGYMFIAEVDDLAPYRERAASAGFRIAGGADYPQYQDLHLDPRDTGGAMLAFSLQREGVPFDGGWYPAGAHWREAVRPAARAITGTEIACRDPAGVGGRWSAAIGRPLLKGPDGRMRIVLRNAEASFLPADGGDRLTAINLEVADRGATLAAARGRGLPIEGDAVRIGGVWFRLS